MKQSVNPVIAIVVGVILLAGIGFTAWKIFSGKGDADNKIVVKAPDPNDPKFQPKLPSGMSGGGQ